MKRLMFLLIFLLAVILMAYAESNRPAHTAATASQKEISAKLDELEARTAVLQAQLNVSHEILLKRGQNQ